MDSKIPDWAGSVQQLAWAGVLLGLSACTSYTNEPSAGTAETSAISARRASDLYVVDCLVPGQLRVVGGRTYPTPRRPTRMTAAECETRGGEYLLYDRANDDAALEQWMGLAQGGDAEAQMHVGELYERGAGGEPDYSSAARWYRNAADQGNSRAQLNLARLYESGLGVEQNTLQALNWYRQAWGLTSDSLIYQSAMDREVIRISAELETELARKDLEIESVEARLAQEQIASGEDRTQQSAKILELENILADVQAERGETEQKLAALPVLFRAPSTEEDSNPVEPPASAQPDNARFGNFYALLIGVQNYDVMDDLETPLNDINRIGNILETRYGFSVHRVADGDDAAILGAINDLRQTLGETDNLLLYFAGHGVRVGAGSGERGYWLPSNAELAPRDTFWVPNEQIVGHLQLLKARRVLLVSDSCFAELLAEDGRYLFLGTQVPDYSNEELLEITLRQRSRLLMSSGDDRPVLDSGGYGHSVFARAFLETLEANDRILAAPALYAKLNDRVTELAATNGFEQKPQYKTVTSAGHEMGDFFFVPTNK